MRLGTVGAKRFVRRSVSKCKRKKEEKENRKGWKRNDAGGN